MAKCKTKDPVNKEALSQIASIHSRIESSYDQNFGAPLIEVNAPTIKRITNNLKDLQLDINLAKSKGDKSTVISLNKQKKSLINQRKSLETGSMDAARKLEFLVKLRSLLTGTVKDYADKNMYDINPDLYFPVIKEYLIGEWGRPFKDFSDLYLGDLRGMYHKLNRMYRVQDKVTSKEIQTGKIPTLRKQHSDPATIALKHDPSMRAYNLIAKSRLVPTEIFSKVNTQDNTVRDAVTPLQTALEVDKFLFRVDSPPSGQVGSEELGPSMDNAVKFGSDVLDGRTKYIIPKPIGIVKKSDPRFKDLQAFQRDRKEYEKRARKDILSGINDGNKIQKLDVSGQTFYYIPIKQPIEEHGGKEVWFAYQVLHKPGEGNTDFLFLPRSKGKTTGAEIKRQEFDELLGKIAPLATFTSKDGREIKGRMSEGWYNATDHPTLSGKTKFNVGGQLVEKQFNIANYSDYKYIDNINPTNDPQFSGKVPPGFWAYISDMRNMYESYYFNVADRIKGQEARMSALINKINKTGNPNMDRKELTALLQEITQLDNVRSGMSIRDGKIFTANTIFSEQETYFPRRWDANGTVVGMIKGIQAMEAKRNDMVAEIAGKQEDTELTGTDHMEALTNLNKLKNELEASIEATKEKLDVYIGHTDMHKAKVFPIETAIAAAQHRSAFMDPLPGPTGAGRRGDIDVNHEYFYDTERGIAYNDLKYELMNVISNSTLAVGLFSLDQVKATMGRTDIEAGAFGVNYNDEAIVQGLNKTFMRYRGEGTELTPTMAHRAVRAFSMLLSGNLLQFGPVFNNHWQRLSPWAHSTAEEYITTKRIMKQTIPVGMKGEGRLFVDVIAEESGARDVVTALADALIGSMSSEIQSTDGFWTKKDLAILKLPLVPFKNKAKNSMTWKTHYAALLERRTDVTRPVGEALEDIFEGTWMLVNGITEGSLSNAQKKRIEQLYQGILTGEMINKYASWGLSGGYLAGAISSVAPVTGKRILTFVGVEEDMRGWTACLACVMAVQQGMIPREWIEETDDMGRRINNPYLHPNALKFARILNNITMFGLSDQFLNVAQRGSAGKTIWKFKGYTYQQGLREFKAFQNMMDSLSEAKLRELIYESMMLLKPSIAGTTGTKRVSHAHETFKRNLWNRGFISMFGVFFFYMPVVYETAKYIKNKSRSHSMGFGFKAMERGGASVLLDPILRALYLLFAASGIISPGDEDEENVYEDLYRYFLPIIVNMGIDGAKGDFGKVFRVMSQTPWRLWEGFTELTD